MLTLEKASSYANTMIISCRGWWAQVWTVNSNEICSRLSKPVKSKLPHQLTPSGIWIWQFIRSLSSKMKTIWMVVPVESPNQSLSRHFLSAAFYFWRKFCSEWFYPYNLGQAFLYTFTLVTIFIPINRNRSEVSEWAKNVLWSTDFWCHWISLQVDLSQLLTLNKSVRKYFYDLVVLEIDYLQGAGQHAWKLNSLVSPHKLSGIWAIEK